ncbi:MAG: AsmA-like C-terminal region-containing protein [Victivallaceae bacterium]|nr:AsmA-like C-terminal region-containing protein [Victivallaceae bacterium]
MAAAVKKGKRILKIILITLSALVLFILIAFPIITSSAFITGIALPLVSNAAGMRIAARQVDLSLFQSRLAARDITVGSGKVPLVKAGRLDGRFSLSDLLKGRFVFRDVTLDKATVTVARDAAGKWTYEAAGATSAPAASEKAAPAGPTRTPRQIQKQKPEKVLLDLKNIQITDSTFILATDNGDNAVTRLEFDQLNISLPEFNNNHPAKLTLKSNVAITSGSGIAIRQGNWKLTLDAACDDYFRPYDLRLDSRLDQLAGVINGVEINNGNLALNLEAHGDSKSITVKRLGLRQQDGQWIKTDVQLSSRIDFEPFQIKGKFKIAPLSPEIVNIITQFARRFDPGQVGVNWTSDFEYSAAGFSGAGKLRLTRTRAAIIAGEKYELPKLRLEAKYDLRLDRSANTLRVKYLTAELEERDQKVLSLSTDRAFTCRLDKGTVANRQQPRIALQIRQLDLSLLRLLRLPEKNFVLNGGRLDGDLVCVPSSGQKLLFDANLKADNLDFRAAGQRFQNIGFEQRLSGYLTRGPFLSLSKFHLNLNRKQNPLLEFFGAGSLNLKQQTADFSVKLANFSSRKIAELPLPPATLGKITEVTSKLEPFSITASAGGSVKLDQGSVKLNPLHGSVFQQNRKVLALTLRPEGGRAENFAQKAELALEVKDLALSQCRNFIPGDTLSQGYLNGKIIAGIADNWKSITLNSGLSVDKLELLCRKELFRNLRFTLDGKAALNNFDQLKIWNLNCGMQQDSRPVLKLSGAGSLESSRGIGKLALNLDCLNHHFLNLLTAGKFGSGVLKGGINVDISERFRHLRLKSDLDLRQLSGGVLTETVDGKSSLDLELKPELFLCRKIIIELTGKNGKIALIDGSTSVPGRGSQAPVVIRLNSKIIDVRKIKQLFAHPEKNGAAAVAPPVESTLPDPPPGIPQPLRFDLGRIPYVVLLDLRGIKCDSVLAAQVSGEIFGQQQKIALKSLKIISNGDELTSQGNFLSTPRGIKYNFDLKSDKFDLTPIFHAFLPERLKTMQGKVEKLHINLAGTGLRPAPLWDNLVGFAKADLADVKIPSNLNHTMIGRIVLLPFSILADIQKMLPGRVLQSLGEVLQFVDDFHHNLKTISFNEGKINLESGDGVILIKDFHFSGDIVKELSFIGQLGLGSRYFLRLKSSLNISGIILPVDMKGTVRKPKINYRATTVNFMSTNAFNILDTTGKIIEKGSEGAREILHSIFQ